MNLQGIPETIASGLTARVEANVVVAIFLVTVEGMVVDFTIGIAFEQALDGPG